MSDGGLPRLLHEEDVAVGATVELTTDESEHGAQSLRLRVDDLIELVNGRGHVAAARVTGVQRRRLTVLVTEQSFDAPPDRPRLVVGLGLLKGPRFDVALEKLTELGVDVIVPLITQYSEVLPAGRTKFDRWGRIVVSAMKQCRRTWRPELRPPTPMADLLTADADDVLLVGHPAPAGVALDLPRFGTNPQSRTETLLVGPEGGWAPDELDRFRKAGVYFISLGPNRLRAETAAVTLLAWRSLGFLGAWGSGSPGPGSVLPRD
ncbi:MAG: 16S rRNA (uracil1498-N3)-methyltransferase [bacterium]|nr:MAG: 16S rRNA (uracil1498-N3)-methyltransferase [bacterium]